MNAFEAKLTQNGLTLRRGALINLQVNVGRKCNQACRHCHVDAGPWRTEMMDAATSRRIAEWIQVHRPQCVDLTGGAPELSDQFRFLVEAARAAGCRIIDRCNLTIIEEPGFGWLPEFLAMNEVEIIASLPCYLDENVRKQRGNGVFDKSIRALRKLNEFGYGTHRKLNLIYNPVGPDLPPPQAELEADYKTALARDHCVVFSNLFTITNQPIARFAEDLRQQNKWDAYLELLSANFNPATIDGLMCRNTLSVGWHGKLYDCDFNQMLNMQLRNGHPLSLWDVTPDDLKNLEIQTGIHCLACTAGCGSSCNGSLA